MSLSLTLVVLSQRAAATEAPDPDQLRAAISFIAEAFGEMEPTKGQVPETAERAPIPADLGVEGAKKGIALFAKSFYFDANAPEDKGLSYEGDTYHVPGGDLVTGRLLWTAARNKAGKNLIAPKAGRRNEGLRPLDDLDQGDLSLLGGRAGEVQLLQGQLTVRYPTGMVSGELPASGAGGEKRLSSVACRTLRVENDVAIIWCSGAGRGITLHPVSASGVVLHTPAMSRGPYAVYRELEKSGRLDSAALERLVAAPGSLDKDGVAIAIRASGKIAKVIALEPAGFQEDTVKVEAFPRPRFQETKGCPAVPAPRYAPARQWPAFAELDDARVKKGTVIRADRSEAMIGFNNQVISIELPTLPNSLLATVEVKDLVLLKGAKKVAFEPQGPFRDREEGAAHRFSFRMEPTEGQTPVDFDVAKGTIDVRYPAKVATRRVKRGEADPSLVLKGCEVRVWHGSTGLEASGPRPAVRAFGANGLELAAVKNVSISGFEGDRSYTVLRFWGDVAAAELDDVKEWRTVKLPLRLQPAPARPRP